MAEAEFPVARCGSCAKDVLCYLALEDDPSAGAEVVRCVGCAMPIPRAIVRWVGFHAIEDLGYGVVVPEGGCGRPDCGRGRCGGSA